MATKHLALSWHFITFNKGNARPHVLISKHFAEGLADSHDRRREYFSVVGLSLLVHQHLESGIFRYDYDTG